MRYWKVILDNIKNYHLDSFTFYIFLIDRAKVEKKLLEKEEEIEKLSAEMKNAVNNLQLDLDMLRESNNQLVADLVRVEQERMLSEEKIETEKVQLKIQAEEEKDSIITSYEELLSATRAESKIKEEQLNHLVEKLTSTEDALHQQLAEKEQQLEDAKTMHEKRVVQLTNDHQEEIRQLHKNYEKVIADKEENYNVACEQLNLAHQEAMETEKGRLISETRKLEDELRESISNLEQKLVVEKETLGQTYTKEFDDMKSSYEEKLAALNKHHEDVVEALNKNVEEASDNVTTFSIICLTTC